MVREWVHRKITNSQCEKLADNLGLFYLTDLDVNYVSGTGFTVVINNPDLVLELMELLLNNWREKPAPIKSAEISVWNAQTGLDMLVLYFDW